MWGGNFHVHPAPPPPLASCGLLLRPHSAGPNLPPLQVVTEMLTDEFLLRRSIQPADWRQIRPPLLLQRQQLQLRAPPSPPHRLASSPPAPALSLPKVHPRRRAALAPAVHPPDNTPRCSLENTRTSDPTGGLAADSPPPPPAVTATAAASSPSPSHRLDDDALILPPAPALSRSPAQGASSLENTRPSTAQPLTAERRAAMGRGSDGTMEPAGAEAQTEARQTSPGLRRRLTTKAQEVGATPRVRAPPPAPRPALVPPSPRAFSRPPSRPGRPAPRAPPAPPSARRARPRPPRAPPRGARRARPRARGAPAPPPRSEGVGRRRRPLGTAGGASGAEPRRVVGGGGGRHGVRSSSGGVPARGPGFPSDLCPRARPSPPCFHGRWSQWGGATARRRGGAEARAGARPPGAAHGPHAGPSHGGRGDPRHEDPRPAARGPAWRAQGPGAEG